MLNVAPRGPEIKQGKTKQVGKRLVNRRNEGERNPNKENAEHNRVK